MALTLKPLCAHCRRPVDQTVSAINRARRIGAPIYCGKACSGLARRKDKTKAQLVAEKRLYDMEYRRKNRALLKAKKRAYFDRTYDPGKAAIERKAKMPRHVEYCRSPAYKAWKAKYDAMYRAKRLYGEFWESAMLALQLDEEVQTRMSRYEIMLANGTLNKALKRKRDYERTLGYRS